MMRTAELPVLPDPSTFVGRKDEFAHLIELHSNARVVTVLGPPGVGKSRLLSEFVRVLRRSGRVTIMVIRPGDLDETHDLAGAVARVESRPLTIVLDDPEFDPAPLVSGLLLLDDDIRVVLGLERRLGLATERVLPLEPFPVPPSDQLASLGRLARQPAMALLLDRAQAHAPGFVLTSRNARDLLRICELADGVPLALELAASRLRALSPAQVSDLLDSSEIVRYGRDADAAHFPSLSAAVARSFAACEPDQQSIWRAAAMFSGPFTLDALARVWRHPVSTDHIGDIVTSLVDRSLLIVSRVGEEVHYRMPRHLALYGQERAAACGELDPLLHRQLALVIELSHDAAAGVFSARQAEWFARFARERVTIVDALRAATSRHLIPAGHLIRTVSALRYFWLMSDDLPDARDLLQAALSDDGVSERDRAEAHWVEAFLAVMSGDSRAAQDALSSARHAPARTTDFVAGLVALLSGDATTADREFTRARSQATDSTPAAPIHGEILFYAGLTKFLLGDLVGLRRVCADAWDVEYDADRWAHAYMQALDALSAWLADSAAAARTQLIGVIRTLVELEDHSGTALALELVSWVDLDGGNATRAAQIFGAVDRMSPISRTLLRGERERQVGRMRTLLGDAAFADETTRGAAKGMATLAAALTDTAAPVARTPSTGLSDRELEIASMIATGLANAEIAQRLVISRRTVEGHVQRILAKLDFGSRTQVATWYVQFVATAVARA